MSSPRRCSLPLSRHVRGKSLSTTPKSCAYSTFLQTAPKASLPGATHNNVAANPLSSPLGKASCVQHMWLFGPPSENRLSKEELSKNIAAMLDEDQRDHARAENVDTECGGNIKLLAGEITHVAYPDNCDVQINSVRLSNVCSPRTILSGRMDASQDELRGKRVVVAVVNNLSLRHSKGVFSEGIILCDHNGALLHPGESSRIGGQIKLVGGSGGDILKHLQFNENGFANFYHGKLCSEDGQIINRHE